MNTRKRRTLVGGILLAGATLLTQTVPAYAQSASVTITAGAGSLGFNPAPGNVVFGGVTSSGVAQSTTASLPYHVDDTTATGAGWNISIAAGNLSDGAGHTIPAANATLTSLTSAPACRTAGSCTPADNSVIAATYPLAMSNVANKVISAAATTGMGTEDFTAGYALLVPGGAVAAAYTATWTMTLSSGP